MSRPVIVTLACLAFVFSCEASQVIIDHAKTMLNAAVYQLLQLDDYSQEPDAAIKQNLLSPKCYEDLRYMKDQWSLRHTSYSATPLWQKQMIDSSGKMPAGLLEGNHMWMGDFLQCTDVKVWKEATSIKPGANPDFKGKYCLPNNNHYIEPIVSQIFTPMIIMAGYGLCVPSTCSAVDVKSLVNEAIYPLTVTLEEKHCLTDDPHPIDQWTVNTLLIFGLLGCLVLVATLWETTLIAVNVFKRAPKITVNEEQGMLKSVVRAFSAYTNTKRLLDTSNKKQALAAIHGLRAISTMSVILIHTAVMILVLPHGGHNTIEILSYIQEIWAQPAFYGTHIVDTFFCITGFLVATFVIDIASKTGQFPVHMFVAHRIWRLAPAYLLVQVFNTGPYHLTFTGPLKMSPIFINATTCRQNLWKNVLFIEIYYDLFQPMWCTIHTWYISCETTVYIMSAIILYPVVKKHWTGPVMWFIAILASLITVAIIADKNNIHRSISYYWSFLQIRDYFQLIYITPWGKAPVFLIGMLFGFVYHYKGKNLKLNKTFVATMWMLTAIGMLGCIYINYPFAIDYYGHGPSHLYSVIYITLSPMIWGLGIGWIMLANATGYGGLVNSILSWKFFVPIARLSYCAYLVHFSVLSNFMSSLKQALYSDTYLLILSSISLTIVTMFFSWIAHILVEAPAFHLEQLIRRAAGTRKTREQNVPSKDSSQSYEKIPRPSDNKVRI